MNTEAGWGWVGWGGDETNHVSRSCPCSIPSKWRIHLLTPADHDPGTPHNKGNFLELTVGVSATAGYDEKL